MLNIYVIGLSFCDLLRSWTVRALDGTAFRGQMLHLIADKPKVTDDVDAGKKALFSTMNC